MAIKGADFWGVYEKADLVETVFYNVNLLAYKSSKKSVSSLLEDAAQKAPAKIALVCQEQKLSYSELLEKVIVMASNLKEKYH
jgi:non-ribosomal peptide synthetase component F